jgi:sec-independent protein translocase protein TatA
MTGWTSPLHIVILLLLALLIFGAKRLPEIGRSLGHGMREFKDSISGDNSDDKPELPPPPAAPVETSRATADVESFSPEERERLRALLDQADERETRAQ